MDFTPFTFLTRSTYDEINSSYIDIETEFIEPYKFLNIILNLMMCAFGFCSVALIQYMNKVELDYVVEGELSKQEWYLIVANHLSWLDIILLTDFGLLIGSSIVIIGIDLDFKNLNTLFFELNFDFKYFKV